MHSCQFWSELIAQYELAFRIQTSLTDVLKEFDEVLEQQRLELELKNIVRQLERMLERIQADKGSKSDPSGKDSDH